MALPLGYNDAASWARFKMEATVSRRQAATDLLMSRTSNSIENQGDTEGVPAQPNNGGSRSSGSRSVCPFCGNINSRSDDRCLRCDMPNTTTTRQATRSRIGPWYVLQSRNPSAPGMKFHTLLNLITKGKVTDRSVVRGPTTHQLWRFAGRVRGISREFGLCYACCAAIEPTATHCFSCQRSQMPPADPDMLLDDAEIAPPRRPVVRDVTPRKEAAKASGAAAKIEPTTTAQATTAQATTARATSDQAEPNQATVSQMPAGSGLMALVESTGSDSEVLPADLGIAIADGATNGVAMPSEARVARNGSPLDTPVAPAANPRPAAPEARSADAKTASNYTTPPNDAAPARTTAGTPVASAPVSIMQALVAPAPPLARNGSRSQLHPLNDPTVERDLAIGGSMASTPRQPAARGILSPEELASAFSLDYPGNKRKPTPFKSKEKPPSVKQLLVGIAAVAACAGVVVAWLSPTIRERMGQWIDLSALTHATTPPSAVGAPTGPKNVTADGSPSTPFVLPPTNDAQPTANNLPSADAGSQTPAASTAANNPPADGGSSQIPGSANVPPADPSWQQGTNASVAQATPVVRTSATPMTPTAAAAKPADDSSTPAPVPSSPVASSPATPVASTPTTSTPVVSAPATPVASAPANPTPVPATPAPAATPGPTAVASAITPANADDGYDEAKLLFDDALDKESHHEYADAVYYWEQIEKLPTQYWPGGTTIHLANDRAILASDRAEGK